MAEKPSYEELEKRVAELKKTAAETQQVLGTLRRENEKFRILVEEAPLGVSLIGRDGSYKYTNPKFVEMFGYSVEDIPSGREWFKKAYPNQEYRDQVVSTWLDDFRTAKTGESSPRIFNVKCRDGSEKTIQFRPVTIEAGEQLIFYEDITERERTEEAMRKSEQRNRALLDFVPYPLVVSTLDGKVAYLNPAFTETFGWTLEELYGERIPYVPPGLQHEANKALKELFDEKIILRHETKRLTKDGRLLDVVGKATIYSESEGEPGGQLVIFRDITQEKRIAQRNEAMFMISRALPEYPDLPELLDYISGEVKRLLGTEGAVVSLLDEEKQELFFPGAAYEDVSTQKRVKEIRFPVDQLASGKVVKTGEPIIVQDASADPSIYPERDRTLGYDTKNYVLVPLRSGDRSIGTLAAINKKEGAFDQTDVELLSTIAATVALSIENARSTEQLKEAYKEATSLNRAKEKVINHLSHELQTPTSVLDGALKIMMKKLPDLDSEPWKRTMERAKRNIDRLKEIQYAVDDILQEKRYRRYESLSGLVDQLSNELETIVADEIGDGPLTERVKKRVEELFRQEESVPSEVFLDEYVKDRLADLSPLFSEREITIHAQLDRVPSISIPEKSLQKIVDGLVKNAIENTPDEGAIEIGVHKRGEGAELQVRDHGVGITEEHQRRIFEGFFPTIETVDYATKKPFEFNAGGKGTDLLRMKFFSERYGFEIEMDSSRCRFIPNEYDICPGKISECTFCSSKEGCRLSGGSSFSLFFPIVLGKQG